MSVVSALDQKLGEIAVNPALPTIALGLDRVLECLDRLGNPQLKLPPVVHIAGTNGKGSTLTTLRAICEANDKSVHAYISPHLVRFNERIVLAGDEVSDDALIAAICAVQSAADEIPLTFFEITTIAAFVLFLQTPADIVLLEVGMGGRLDATNVITPIVSIITPIDYDHKEFLGNTITLIAEEKAGIIKPNVPVVIAKQSHAAMAVIKAVSEQHNVALKAYGIDWVLSSAESDVRIDADGESYHLPTPTLLGAHQHMNAATAYMASRVIAAQMGLDDALSRAAIARVHWPARLQQLTQGALVKMLRGSDTLWVDGGHNAAAACAIASWMRQQPIPITLIVGMMKRKESQAFFAEFVALQPRIITITFDDADASTAQELAQSALAAGNTNVITGSTIEDAISSEIATNCRAKLFLICGSLYLAGKVLQNNA